jgi:homoserine dehydrogenase
MRLVRIGLLGAGTVGGGVIKILSSNDELLTKRTGMKFVVTRVATKEPPTP